MKNKNLIRSYSVNMYPKQRVRVKAFASADSMNQFLLNTSSNALSWRVVSDKEFKNGLNKSGVYIERGLDFLNVKNIPVSALAHM